MCYREYILPNSYTSYKLEYLLLCFCVSHYLISRKPAYVYLLITVHKIPRETHLFLYQFTVLPKVKRYISNEQILSCSPFLKQMVYLIIGNMHYIICILYYMYLEGLKLSIHLPIQLIKDILRYSENVLK